MSFKHKGRAGLFAAAILCCRHVTSAIPAESMDSLMQRVLPASASSFSYAIIPADSGRDVFELSGANGKILVKGNSTGSLAMGLGYYLKHFCNIHLSLTGNQTRLGALPSVTERVVVPKKYRYALNYCTYNYSFSFWNWKQWEDYLDLLSLSGVNIALAGVFGQEAIWRNTLKQFGYSDSDIGKFLVGPTLNAWMAMGNIEGEMGPVPPSLIQKRLELEQKIVARMRQLGIAPVLQGFYGVVPTSLKSKYAGHVIYATGKWFGYPRPDLLDPTDPLFDQMAKAWYAQSHALFGPTQFYGGDPLHESKATLGIDMTAAGKAIQKAMQDADPGSTWVLQGWGANPTAAMLAGLDKTKTLILFLHGETRTTVPSWNNIPFVWTSLANVGGQVGLYGPLQTIGDNYFAACGGNSRCVGVGAMPEGMLTNSVTWDYNFDLGWRKSAPDLNTWLKDYSIRRYGKSSAGLQSAWALLGNSVYKYATTAADPENYFDAIPAATIVKGGVGQWGEIKRDYNNQDLVDAWKLFLGEENNFAGVETYEHDLVDITRQLMSNQGVKLYTDMMSAYNAKDTAQFRKKSGAFLDAILDLDSLLATDRHFLFGKYLADARAMGETDAEKQYYMWTARSHVTIWTSDRISYTGGGTRNYSHRDWAGLHGGIHHERWKAFADDLMNQLKGKPATVFDWFGRDSAWCRKSEAYDSLPRGSALEKVNWIAKKYFAVDVSASAIGPRHSPAEGPGYAVSSRDGSLRIAILSGGPHQVDLYALSGQRVFSRTGNGSATYQLPQGKGKGGLCILSIRTRGHAYSQKLVLE
jgi:alpha-N-acetylglucosaminidase